MATEFRLWVFGCAHLTRDIGRGRESLGDALRQSETPEFDGWHAAINLGDNSGGLGTPTQKEGEEVRRQYRALIAHPREAIYDIQGNHDREGPGEPPGWWFRRFVDPMGENPHISGVNSANRPYPITGTWERYRWQVGNLVFLMISDVARPFTNLRGLAGGDPGGVYTQETFEWWKNEVESCRKGSEIVITCHHYLPKDTTCGTGNYEGGEIDADGFYRAIYHGPGRDPRGSGRLHYKGEEADATDFIDHLAQHEGDSALWLGGHTHAVPGTEIGGKKLRTLKHGCHFVNCAALTKYHGAGKVAQYPKSRVFIFEHGASQIIVKNWYHDTSYAPGIGYHGTDEILTLARPIHV